MTESSIPAAADHNPLDESDRRFTGWRNSAERRSAFAARHEKPAETRVGSASSTSSDEPNPVTDRPAFMTEKPSDKFGFLSLKNFAALKRTIAPKSSMRAAADCSSPEPDMTESVLLSV